MSLVGPEPVTVVEEFLERGFVSDDRVDLIRSGLLPAPAR